jgi:hypothetical protein
VKIGSQIAQTCAEFLIFLFVFWVKSLKLKDLQLKIWLSKPPGERLRQQLVGFYLGFTFCIDENKIIYSCTDNKFGDATHKMVFLVFDEVFELY